MGSLSVIVMLFIEMSQSWNAIQSYQPDNQIKNSDETVYIGDNIYNTTGTNQTKSQQVTNNQTAGYHIRIENDGDAADSFTVTATASGPAQWVANYFDALSGGTNITSEITGSGWSTGSLDPGQYREIRVEVVADWFWYDINSTILVTSVSQGDNSKKDAVRATTQFRLDYQPDNLIKNLGETSYIGGNIYNTDGTGQTKEQEIEPGQTATYHIKIENDGNCPALIQVIGTESSGKWTVKYYDALNNGTDVTSQVTGDSGWVMDLESPTATQEMRVEVMADGTTPEGDLKTVLVGSISSGDTAKKDIVKAITSIPILYWPDNQIKNSDESDYMGNGIYNTDGSGQTKNQTLENNDTAVYHIRIENDGKKDDSFLVKGTSSSGGWIVNYFDALTGRNDITSGVIEYGWSTGNLNTGNAKEIRVEIIPSEMILGGDSLEILITSSSEGNGERKDAVKAITQVAIYHQPDNQVKNPDETTYTGDNLYNATGDGQTKNQSVAPNQTAAYHIRVENDGNIREGLKVTGDGGVNGWEVKYFDALSGGTDITSQITDSGWLIENLNPNYYKELRVEVTPDQSVPEDSAATVAITSVSQSDTDKKDVVKVVTTSKGISIEEKYPKVPNSYILYPNSPNPFGDYTTIEYGIPKIDRVILSVYDITGKLVRVLVNEEKKPGYYTLFWDGKDALGKEISNGIYFYKFEAGNYSSIKKMLLLRK